MYAQSKRSRIYHLLYSTFDYTLCGQKTTAVYPENSHEVSGLGIISEQSPDRKLCKQCEQMEQRTNRTERGKAAGL